jgi:hypothetical protein
VTAAWTPGGVLFVLDGGKALAAAIRAVFGALARVGGADGIEAGRK